MTRKGLFSKNNGRYGELGHWGKRDPKFSFGKFVTTARGKILILSLVALAFTGAFAGMYFDSNNDLFHSTTPNPPSPTHDPTTPIQKYTAPNNNLGEFNNNGASSYTTSCGTLGSQACINMATGSGIQSSGTCVGAPDSGGGAASADYSTNHKTFFQLGRWWIIYTNNTAGPNEGLSYSSFTSVNGPSRTTCPGFVEGYVKGTGGLFTSTPTGGEYAVDSNSSQVWIVITPRTLVVSFTFGTLNSNGTITNWQPIQTIATETSVPSAIVWDGSIQYQTSTGQLYIFYNYLDGATNHIFSIEKYTVSTNSLLTTFAGIQTVLTGISQDDIPVSLTDLHNGTMYGVYGQFFQMNTTGLPNFLGRSFQGSTMGSQITIPKPASLGNLQPGFFYTWSQGKGKVAGNFGWARIGNQTFINDFWYASASPTWTTPTQVNPDPAINPLAAQLNLFPYTACETYDSTFNQTSAETAGGVVPWKFYTNDIFKTNGTGTPSETFLGITSTVPLTSGWDGTNAGTGICPLYTNSLHQQLWGYLNGTNTNNKCNGVNGGGPPCSIIVGLTTLGNPTACQCGFVESVTPIGDLSPVVSKELEAQLLWVPYNNNTVTSYNTTTIPGTVKDPNRNTAWGFFLTTNASLWQTSNPNWNPWNDSSVVLMVQNYLTYFGTSKHNYISQLYIQQSPATTLQQEDTGCSVPQSGGIVQSSGSAFLCTDPNPSFLSSYQQSWMQLNFTGSACIAGTNCAGSQGGPSPNCPTNVPLFSGGPGCSYLELGQPATFTGVGTTARLPSLLLSGQSYYAGFWMGSGQTGSTFLFCFDTGATCGGQHSQITNGCESSSMEFDYCIPNPVPTSNTPQASTDSGGWIGSIWRGFTSLGGSFLTVTQPLWGPVASSISSGLGSIYNDFVGGMETVGSFMVNTALPLFELAMVTVLNVLGNKLGFGNVGTDLQTLINQLVTFFTVDFPQIITNLPALFARFFDVLTLYFPWIPIAFGNAQKVLLLGINSIGFIITVIGVPFQFVAPSYTWILTFLFFFYVMDDGIGGLQEYFESMQFLVFNVGLNFTFHVINFGLDIVTGLIGLIPKPFIQMATHAIPRLPLFDSTARFIFPRFDMAAIRSGDLFGILLWIAGFDFWIRYNSAIPALPGSLPALNSGTAGMMVTMSAFLPLTEIFLGVFFFVGLSFWGLMRGITLLSIDAGVLEDIPISIGLGQSRATGGHVTGIRTAKKHFQRKTPGGPALGGPMTGAPQLPLTVVIDRRIMPSTQPINITPPKKELPE